MINLYLLISGIVVIGCFISYIYYKGKKSAKMDNLVKLLKETEKEDNRVKQIKDDLSDDNDRVVSDELRKYIRDKD